MARQADWALALRKVYYQRLSSILSVRVYDAYGGVPPGAGVPFVVLADTQLITDRSHKDGFIGRARQEVHVVTKYEGGAGGRKQADEIASQIVQTINDRDNRLDLTTEGFQCVTTVFEDTGSNEINTDSGRWIVRVLRFEHIISQL